MSAYRWRMATDANHREFEAFSTQQERWRGQNAAACPSCGHVWDKHTDRIGCVERVDSAYTHDNTRLCGCTARPT